MTELTDRQLRLLEDAAAWRLIGLAFERPRGEWADAIRSIANEREIDERVATLAEEAAEQGSEPAFLAAFGPGGRVSPREVTYRRMGDPGRILAELKIMYDAFSFTPETEEPPDHVSVEVGFVGFLRLKEAFALNMDDEESARLIREAAEVFVNEHLVYLAAGLDSRIEDGYLKSAVVALTSRVGPIPSEIAQRVVATAGSDLFEACGSGCSFEPEAEA